MVRYEPYSEVKKIYHVSGPTLQKWAKKGHIRYRTIQNEFRKTWLYDIDSIGEHMGGPTNQHEHRLARDIVLYARVSSSHQREDLQRQEDLLRAKYPDAPLLSEIGSGVNYERKKFTALVRRICAEQVEKVVVTHKDRLLRFGYPMFEQICKCHDVEIVVLGKSHSTAHSDANGANDEETKDDLLSIVNIFVAQRNGRRSAELRKMRTLQQQQETTTKQTRQDKTQTNLGAEKSIKVAV